MDGFLMKTPLKWRRTIFLAGMAGKSAISAQKISTG
jgi:hypothetical protein